MNDHLVFAQVIMGDRPAAERACKEPNPIIDGRKANVNLAILGAKPRGNLQPGKILSFDTLYTYTDSGEVCHHWPFKTILSVRNA